MTAPDMRGSVPPDDGAAWASAHLRDDQEIAHLAALPPLDYDRARAAAAEAMGVRVSTLDDLVRAARPKADTSHGQGVKLREAEPWEEPVELSALLNDLECALVRHVVLPDGAATALALWVAHTWVFERFEHTPRLAVRSPAKRCGKTVLLEVVEALCRRPLWSGSISASSAFRIVEALSPVTLLLDETDSFLADKEELRGVLNSGFQRNGAVVRTQERNGEFEPVQFRTFAPVAFAGIGALPDTLEDRSVPVVLQRKAAKDQVGKLRAKGVRTHLGQLASKLARRAEDDAAFLNLDPEMPEAMGDRKADICVPLVSIADAASSAWGEKGRRALLTLFRRRAGDEANTEAGAMLLADMRSLFSETGATRLSSAEAVDKLGKMGERPWPEWRQGKPMTAPQLASALRPFGIRPTDLRRPDEVAKGYQRDHFDEAWRSYLPDEEVPLA